MRAPRKAVFDLILYIDGAGAEGLMNGIIEVHGKRNVRGLSRKEHRDLDCLVEGVAIHGVAVFMSHVGSRQSV